MNISIPNRYKDEVRNLGIEVPPTTDKLGRASFSLALEDLKPFQLDKLYSLFQKYPAETRNIRVQINAWKRQKEDEAADPGQVPDFEDLRDALEEHVAKDAIRGWVFLEGDDPQAYLITRISHAPAYYTKDHDYGGKTRHPAVITLTAQHNDHGKSATHSFSITDEDDNPTPLGFFAKNHLQKESAELIQWYDEEAARYRGMRGLYGKQLRLRKSYIYDPEAESRKGRRWYDRDEESHYKKDTKIELMEDNAGRLVQDDPVQEEGEFKVERHRRWDDPDNPNVSASLRETLIRTKAPKESFTQTPLHMYLETYHLGQHRDLTVHSRHVEVYQYDKHLREKLILPGMYNDVLDVLTHDMLLVQNDLVEGKAGGNVIALCGMPGLAKTLTAEVYSEHREVPLLKVHSGQLGTTAKEIEAKLIFFYKKATDWGCPILIDEADVFVRERGNDLEQNAIVAVFLRTLEYQKNTIFLTTNRAQTIDDAIISRCAAVIRYDYPEGEILRDIWRVQRDQHCPSVTDGMIDNLMRHFAKEKKQMSGRDVKQIMRLASRYEQTGRKVDEQLLITCAGFRGV